MQSLKRVGWICIIATVRLGGAPCLAGPIGANLQVSQSPAAFPDAAYSTGSDKYLVAYGHGLVRGRLVSPAGELPGPEFAISSEQADGGGLYPDIAYNAIDDEFLVVWDDQRTPPPGQAVSAAWGQRIRAGDGARLGENFPIGDTDSFAVSVAWSPIGNSYLVVWRAGGTTRGRWVSGAGTPQGDAFCISAFDFLYPNVAFGSTSFLVTWDDNGGTAVGRCLAPGATQAGALIPVSGAGAGWRTALAYDPGTSAQPARWLVQFTHIGLYRDFDQYGAFVTDACTADGAIFPIAEQPAHEGDTNFGAAIAFIPQPGRYLSIFQASGGGFAGTSVQELDRAGQPRGSQDFISSGDELGQAVAADPEAGRFLAAWYNRQHGAVLACLYEPIKPVTQLQGFHGSRAIRLRWVNPATADFVSTVIRYKFNGFPTSPNDGFVAADRAGAPGETGTFRHAGLSNGTAVYYAAYAKDSRGHLSDPMFISVVPGLSADFDRDADVDQEDFGLLQRCLAGENQDVPDDCLPADLDVNGDVDPQDGAIFAGCFAGPGHPPGCGT